MALATLTIDINAKLANIEQDLGKVSHLAEKSAARMDAAFGAAKAAFAGMAAAFSVGALIDNIKGIIDLGDEMNDLSQRVGISVKDLATWKLAAEQSGTSLESVAKGVKGLSTFMVENSAELKKAGIAATDANGALIELADLFTAMPDGVEKTALAVKLFGKAGMDMLPMLNQGSAGLKEAQEKAKAFGERMELLAPQADKFNDQMAEMALQSKIMGMNVANYLLPGLTGMATWLNDLKAGGERAETALEFLSEKSPLMRGLIQWNKFVNGGESRSQGFSGPKNALGLPLGDLERQAADLAAFDAATDAYMKQREARQRGQGLLGKGAAGEKAAKSVGSVDDYASRVNQAVGSAINNSAVVKSRELNDQLVALGKLFMESGLDAEIYASALEKLTGYTDKASEETERLNQMLAATPTAKLEEARKDMELLAESLEAGRISEEQFSEAAQARLGTLGEAVKEVDNFARDMGLSFSSAFEDAMIGGKNFSDVLKGLGQDIERIILRKTITEPLGNSVADFIKGDSKSGSSLTDRVKGLFGFASGGAFTVGGAGGTDSQLVAFKATPGEEVTVRTPAQQGGAGNSVVIHQAITVDSRSDQASIMQAMVAAKNAAVAQIHNSMRRGGSFA
jgi:hypothetical protein